MPMHDAQVCSNVYCMLFPLYALASLVSLVAPPPKMNQNGYLFALIIESSFNNTIFVNRRLLKVSKLNMPIVWDANIVGI